MARITYDGIDLGEVRTHGVTIEPVMSDDGVDMVCQKVTIDVETVLNRSYFASFQGRAENPPQGALGDNPAVSLDTLRQTLMTPRRQLTLDIGPDRVINAPGITVLNGDDPPDAANGPFPQRCRLFNVTGTRTAWLQYTVVCYVNDCDVVVPSNRWKVETRMDEDFYTTRIVSGRLTARTDLLAEGGKWIDQFRRAAVLPVPDGYRRVAVHVSPSTDGRTLDYQAIDVEQPLNIGSLRSKATKIGGTASFGADYPIKDATQSIGRGLDWARYGLLAVPGLGPYALAGGYLAGTSPKTVVPRLTTNCMIQVTGQKDASKADLAALALQIAMDRFRPLGGVFGGGGADAVPTSVHLTQSLAERYVELRCQFYVGLKQFIDGTLDRADFGAHMNLDTDIQTDQGALTGTPKTNIAPPNGAGTYGTSAATLLTAALQQPCTPPSLPANGAPTLGQYGMDDQPLN